MSIGFVLLLAACVNTNPSSTRQTNLSATETREPSGLEIRATPVRVWSDPYPYLLPLPNSVVTPVDGVYAKSGTRVGTPVPCRRCPDYLPYEGDWILWLERGVFRVHFRVTGWRSVGSFTLEGNQIKFFNDPNCTTEIGIYRWEKVDTVFKLTTIDDACMFGIRAANFSETAWASCLPPNQEAGITDHWYKPSGC